MINRKKHIIDWYKNHTNLFKGEEILMSRENIIVNNAARYTLTTLSYRGDHFYGPESGGERPGYIPQGIEIPGKTSEFEVGQITDAALGRVHTGYINFTWGGFSPRFKYYEFKIWCRAKTILRNKWSYDGDVYFNPNFAQSLRCTDYSANQRNAFYVKGYYDDSDLSFTLFDYATTRKSLAGFFESTETIWEATPTEDTRVVFVKESENLWRRYTNYLEAAYYSEVDAGGSDGVVLQPKDPSVFDFSCYLLSNDTYSSGISVTGPWIESGTGRYIPPDNYTPPE